MKTNCINLLMIGNSFAYNTVDHLIELAKIYGVKLEVGVLFIGGCSIDTHYENFVNGNKNYEFRYITNEKDEVTFNYSIQEALDFKKWENGVKLSENLKTVRSAKDFFFPKTEHMVSYEMKGQEIKVTDPRKDIEDFVIFGVRACDAVGFTCIDNVYLNMDPVDSYYKNRRDHGTVITLACNNPEKTCFCSTYGIDSSLNENKNGSAGDVSCWNTDGKYFFVANTAKGEKFINDVKSVLAEADEKAVEACKKDISDKMEKLPFAHLDLSKFQGKDMLKIFNSKVWETVSEACVGCGTCTYVCPTCM